MATVPFTGTLYRGSDGSQSLVLTTLGHYQVSDAKAAQFIADFPHEFALVPEGRAAKGSSSDPETKQVEAPIKTDKPAKKAS